MSTSFSAAVDSRCSCSIVNADTTATPPNEDDTSNINESLPPDEPQEQAKDIDTMESQKEKLLKSSLEISLTRDKDDKSAKPFVWLVAVTAALGG